MSRFGRKDECPPEVKPPDYPRFCSRCGSALAYECDAIGFDEKTGAPQFYRWAHCPKWTGFMHKIIAPGFSESAAFLNATFTARLYESLPGIGERFYLDCRPQYQPRPAPPVGPTDFAGNPVDERR